MGRTAGSRLASDRKVARERLLDFIREYRPTGVIQMAKAGAEAAAGIVSSFDAEQAHVPAIRTRDSSPARSSAQTGRGSSGAERTDTAVNLTVQPLRLLLEPHGEWVAWSAHKVIKRGISSQALAPLGEYLGLSKAEIANLLGLNQGTVRRRVRADEALPAHAAERVLRLLEIDTIALSTFSTDDDATGWLRTPHPLLGDETPLESTKTSFGTQRVKEILHAMRWGGVA